MTLAPQSGAAPSREEMEAAFATFRRVGAAMRARFQLALAQSGLTFPQWFLLKHVRMHGRVAATELAEALDVSPANVTGMVDRLEREGLAARARSDEDRRVVFVTITPAGRAKMRAIEEAGANEVLAQAFAGWTREDVVALRALLERLNLQDAEC